MPEKRLIEEFLAQRHLAFVGVSRDPKQFANSVYRHLRDGGRTLYPVNAQLAEGATIEGDRGYRSVLDVPDPVEGVVVMLPRDQILPVLEQAATRGVPRVWLHRGGGPAVAPELVEFCRAHGLDVVDGACPFMFAEPVKGFHRFHRFFSGRRIAV